MLNGQERVMSKKTIEIELVKTEAGYCRALKQVSHFFERLNRPGYEMTPRSWTVTIPPVRSSLLAGSPPG